MKKKLVVTGGLAAWLTLSAVVLAVGQPSPEELYELRKDEYEPRLLERKVQIAPAELLSSMYDTAIDLKIIDLRDESDFNLFHLQDAEWTSEDALDKWYRAEAKANRLIVLVSNDETRATEVWRKLVAMRVGNVYLLDGGINGWLKAFSDRPVTPGARRDEQLAYHFNLALGARHPEARPPRRLIDVSPFEQKVKLKTKARKGGGCG